MAIATPAPWHRFEGQFVNGKKQGQGTYTFANGGKYEGTFTNDAIAGQGVRTCANGDRRTGRIHGRTTKLPKSLKHILNKDFNQSPRRGLNS